ncbi:unnamed protein product [Urochloa humidicola]
MAAVVGLAVVLSVVSLSANRRGGGGVGLSARPLRQRAWVVEQAQGRLTGGEVDAGWAGWGWRPTRWQENGGSLSSPRIEPLLPGTSSCPSSPARRRAMELPRTGRVHARGRSWGSLSSGASTSGWRGAEERGMVPPSMVSPPPCAGGEERRRDPAASGRRSSPLPPAELAHEHYLRSVTVVLDPRPLRLLLSPRGLQDPWRRWWGSRSCCLVHPSSHHVNFTKKNRIHNSGPLMPPGVNIDEILRA